METRGEVREFGVEYYNEFDPRQGIVHIIGPEQGFTLPGTTSSAEIATPRRMGPSARSGMASPHPRWSMCSHPNADPEKGQNMCVTVDGALAPGVTAKDIILAIIGEIGTAGGTGYVIEYAGEAIRALSIEGP